MSIDNYASLIDCTITIGIGLYLTLARSRVVAKIADPLKKERAISALRWAGPAAIVGGVLIAFSRIGSLEDPATRAARMINTSSPKMIDPITRFDRATAGPGQRVVIDQTITNVSAAQVPRSKWEAVVPELRKKIENSGIGKLPAQGITIVYRYHDKDGALIGEVILTPPSKT